MGGVTHRYPGASHPALRDVDLDVRPGEILGILGESGAGKSTLLNLITGTILPTSGSVRVLGQPTVAADRREMRALRRRIGVVFQGVHLLANRTVADNVALPLHLGMREHRGPASRRAVRARARDMLDFVGLADHADRFPAQLSGGQRQRVGIARALAGRPELVLCDEPTSSLDASTADEVLAVLADARDRLRTTVVIVTHDLAVVRAIADRAALFERGVLREVLPVTGAGGRDTRSYLERAREALGG